MTVASVVSGPSPWQVLVLNQQPSCNMDTKNQYIIIRITYQCRWRRWRRAAWWETTKNCDLSLQSNSSWSKLRADDFWTTQSPGLYQQGRMSRRAGQEGWRASPGAPAASWPGQWPYWPLPSQSCCWLWPVCESREYCWLRLGDEARSARLQQKKCTTQTADSAQTEHQSTDRGPTQRTDSQDLCVHRRDFPVIKVGISEGHLWKEI